MAAYHHHHSDRSARRPSSRPRSLYAAQGSTYLSGASSSSYLNNSSPYTSSTFSLPSSFQSQSPYSTYGGTSSGYGGLTLPSNNPYNLSSSPKMTASSYLNNLLQSSNYGSRTGSPTYSSTRTSSPTYSHRPSANRSNSFNRHHSSIDRPSVRSTLGQRSISSLSLKSDTSEGYASGGDKSSRSSRFSSSTDRESTSNGEIDYKKLYEESQVENERLREKLKRTEDDLKESKAHSEKNVSPGKNSMSELEKRERRAMERKLSEMEEELKQLQKLKAENERLRAENRALTRVVSKLTASANAAK